MSRMFRLLLPAVLIAALGACGPDSGVEEPREAAPDIAPGTEPATVPGPLLEDSIDAR